MTMSLLCIFGVLLVSFVSARIVLGILATKMRGKDYALKFDAWLEMLVLLLIGALLSTFFIPSLHDQIVPLKIFPILTTVLCAAVIYGVFMLDIPWLLNVCVGLMVGVLLLFLPPYNILLSAPESLFLDRLLLFCLLTFLTRGATILNGKTGIFLIYASTICMGTIFLSLLGGAPLLLGVLAALIGGVFGAFFNINMLHEKIVFNTGACLSAAFLLSAMVLDLCVEYVPSSALILTLYLPIEFVWAIGHYYLRHNQNIALTDQTMYQKLYDISYALPALWMALAKIGAINVVLACFQLYAPNAFSLPFFAFLLNIWLLSRLFGALEPPTTFKSAHREFIDALKQGVKDTFRKEP